MRAIIIQDTDAQALLDQLKLEELRINRLIAPDERCTTHVIHDIHRSFVHRVVRWLQAQGASELRTP